MPWDRYLASMAQDGEYGDQITLQAAAEIFNIEIFVVSFQSDEQSIEDLDHQLLENRPEEEQEPQKSQE